MPQNLALKSDSSPPGKGENLIERLTSQLQAQGHGEGAREMALGILRKQGSVAQDSDTLTKHGLARSNMTPGERAIDRQSKYSGKPKAAFRYDAKTNRATVKKGYSTASAGHGQSLSKAVLAKTFKSR